MRIQNINEAIRMNMSKSQYLNYLAIDILEKIGNTDPTQAEIDLVEYLLVRLSRRYKHYSS